MKENTEKGAAIVIALGIFALILAVGLNFASQSILNEKIAVNIGDRSSADLFVISARNRFLSEITSNPNQILIYSNSGTDNVDTEYLVDTANGVCYQGNINTKWIYLYNKTDGDNDSEIIGRIAYSVCTAGNSNSNINFGDIGKLNIAACVDSGINAYNNTDSSVTEDTNEKTGTMPSGAKVVGRPGVNVNEIYLSALDTSFTNDSLVLMSAVNSDNTQGFLGAAADTEGTLSVENSSGDLLERGGSWMDIQTFFKDIGVDTDIDNSSINEIKNRLAKKIVLSSVYDPEAFWIDINGDGDISDTQEMFHRFNLARADWPNPGTKDWLETNILGDTIEFSSSLNTDGTCIPWIKNWKLTYDIGPDTAYKYQIAANILDYCDADTVATTDDADSPSFTGNDKTPYINEVRLRYEASGVTILGIITFGVVWHRDISVELVNMYAGGGNNINYNIQLNVDYTFDNIIWREKSNPFSLILPISVDEQSDTFASSEYDELFISAGSGINNFTVNNMTVKLTDGNNNFNDFSFVESNNNIGTLTTSSVYLDYEIADPRQNLFESDWGAPNTGVGTLGSNNSVFTPNPGSSSSDEESDATNPWDISTAFIRNAPMQSPWELGFIHRGQAWQTINLKKYDDADTQGAVVDAGGDAYTSGDANILDQIKMTSASSVLGKVNLNNPVLPGENNPLVALFAYIRSGVDIYNSLAPGDDSSADSVSIADAQLLADYIQLQGDNFLLSTDGSINEENILKTRAQVLEDKSILTGGSGETPFSNDIYTPSFDLSLSLDNDAEQEEIIGKFINLTKANGRLYSNNSMTVLLIAQSIKDVGGVTFNEGKPDEKATLKGTFEQTDDGKGDQILSTTTAIVTLSKEYDTDSWEVVRFEYLD